MTKIKTRPNPDQNKTIGQLLEKVNKLQKIIEQLEAETKGSKTPLHDRLT